MPTEEEIKRLAYEMWERAGRPEGQDRDHYFDAERTLKEREAARVLLTPSFRPSLVAPSPSAPTPLKRRSRKK